MKQMRCWGLYFMALIVIISICPGCVSGPSVQNQTVPPTTPPAGLKVTALTEYNATPQTYSLDDAMAAIVTDNQIRAGNGAQQNFSLCYIQGTNVELSGKAEHWLFGVCGDNTTSMIVYDSHGISRMNWSHWMPDKMIDTSSLLSPAKILGIAYPGRQAITIPQLEVRDGEYILTAPQGETPREFTMNTSTGVLIATHD
jgi:hypothetical protein